MMEETIDDLLKRERLLEEKYEDFYAERKLKINNIQEIDDMLSQSTDLFRALSEDYPSKKLSYIAEDSLRHVQMVRNQLYEELETEERKIKDRQETIEHDLTILRQERLIRKERKEYER